MKITVTYFTPLLYTVPVSTYLDASSFMGAKDILGRVPLEYTDMPVLYSSEMLISLGNATIHKIMAVKAYDDISV